MRPSLAASMLGMVVVAVGCGPDYGRPVKVTGTAKLNGKPLTNAGVRFHCMEAGLPADLRTQSATLDAAGNFEIHKVYPQEYQVSFFELARPAEQKYWPNGDPIILASATIGPLHNYRAETTELRAFVSETSTHFDYDLKHSK